MGLPLVVIDNLRFIGVRAVPSETDAPLLVGPDAVLVRPISSQGIETIAWPPRPDFREYAYCGRVARTFRHELIVWGWKWPRQAE